MLGRRCNQPAKGYLFAPGGRITKNERVAEAFKRIVRSELGVEAEIRDAPFLGYYEHFYNENFYERPGFGTHYVVLAFALALPEPAALDRLPHAQHTEYKWMTVEDLLASPQVHEHTKAYFRSEA